MCFDIRLPYLATVIPLAVVVVIIIVEKFMKDQISLPNMMNIF